METKKSKRANLENMRTIFIQLGIIIALSAALFAFEWKSEVKYQTFDISDEGNIIEEIEMPRTNQDEKKVEVVKPKLPSFTFVPTEEPIDFEDEPVIFDEGVWDTFDPSLFDKREEDFKDSVFINAEIMPTFQGKGPEAFRDYIAKNIRFPEDAVQNGMSGRVYVQFVVDEKGKVTEVTLLRNVHPAIDKEVMRVMKNAPKWEPGLQSGTFVKVSFTIPIVFKFENM